MTTRPNRRVVSTSLLIVAMFFFISLAVARIFVGRSHLLSFVPKDAEAIDLVGRNAILSVVEHIGTVPLLKERSISLQTLLPNIRGEVELIIFSEGQRVVAYRGILSTDEESAYKSQGVFVQRSSGTITLAAKQEDFGLLSHSGTHVGLSALLPGFGGFFQSGSDHSGLYFSKTGMRSYFMSPFSKMLPKLPSSTIAFALFSPESESIPAYIARLLGTGASVAMADLLSGQSGNVLITSDETGIGYRLTINKRLESEVLTKALQSAAALISPTTKSVLLPDGSYVDEIEANTDGVAMSVDELADGVLVKADQGDLHLRARQGTSETVVTNREASLSVTVDAERLKLVCGNHADSFVLPAKLSNLLQTSATTSDVTLSQMSQVEELLILGKNFSICW